MFLLYVVLIVVVTGCGQRDIKMFCLGGLFRRQNSSASTNPLPPVNCWSSSVGASAPPICVKLVSLVILAVRFFVVLHWCGQRDAGAFLLGVSSGVAILPLLRLH